MEITKMIIDYTLDALDGGDAVEMETTLRIAKKLMAALPPYYVEDALKALFQEDASGDNAAL